MILLDTDIFSLLTRDPPNAQVRERLASAAEEVSITVVTQAEVLQGRIEFLLKADDAEQLFRAQEWLRRTMKDLKTLPIVEFDRSAADRFFELAGTKGLKRIGRADLMIAGIASARNATLVTRNRKHFSKVPGLRLENWAD